MGCQLIPTHCATLKNWRTQTGASGAVPSDFAPVRQLRQSLIGKGKLAHLEQRLSRARSLIRTDRLPPPSARQRPRYSPVPRTVQSRCTLVRWPSQTSRCTFALETSSTMKAIEQKPAKQPRIGRKIRQAVELMLGGSCANQKAVCERLGLSESYLSRSLKKDNVQAFITRATAKTISTGKLVDRI
jgi:hypothetical protein